MILVSLVPPAPNLYIAAISAVGLAVSTLSVVLLMMYQWTRPPLQQTMVQPVLTLTAVGSIFNMWKETLIQGPHDKSAQKEFLSYTLKNTVFFLIFLVFHYDNI